MFLGPQWQQRLLRRLLRNVVYNVKTFSQDESMVIAWVLLDISQRIDRVEVWSRWIERRRGERWSTEKRGEVSILYTMVELVDYIHLNDTKQSNLYWVKSETFNSALCLTLEIYSSEHAYFDTKIWDSHSVTSFHLCTEYLEHIYPHLVLT